MTALKPYVLAATLLVTACTNAAPTLAPDVLARVGATPLEGAQARLDAMVIDETGERQPLGVYVGDAPTLLVFLDYRCTYLCGVGLPLLADRLDRMPAQTATGYHFIAFGLDPRDGAGDVAHFRQTRLAHAGAAEQKLVLLRSDPSAIRDLTSSLGYAYTRDPTTGAFAHDAVFYVLTPSARVSAVLNEFALADGALPAALAEARADRTPTIFETIHSLCYAFAAAHGLYSARILLALQAAAFLCASALAGAIVILTRRRA